MPSVFQIDMKEEVAAFKEALRAEYEMRIASERHRMEEDIVERVAERRSQVEKQVTSLRQEFAVEKTRYLGMRKRFLLQELRDRITLLGEELLGAVEGKIEKRLEEESPLAPNTTLLDHLVAEAISALGTSCVVLVPPESRRTLSPRSEIVDVREELDDPWGGCMVFAAHDTRIFVDNTLRTRWRICRAEVGRELEKVLAPFVEEVDRIARELRLS